MIKYETIENKYLYDPKKLEEIIDMIKSGNFFNERNLTQENVSALVGKINEFLNSLKAEPCKVIKERNETEEEARAYFGEEFIQKFDSLLTELDKQETIVALHGTSPIICPNICEVGLQYRSPSLISTAVPLSMANGEHDMHYNNYEELLNWRHRDCKGIVIIAVPLECYYKEGLWEEFQESNYFGDQVYRINPDFIVGYLDIENKSIVLNPKYNRRHNYEGYDKDYELFHEKKGMDNESIRQLIIESKKSLLHIEEQYSSNSNTEEDDLDISIIPYLIDDFIGTFNAVSPDGMSEDRYKYLLEELSYSLNQIQKSIPLLKTKAQIEEEEKEKNKIFENLNNQPTPEIVYDDSVWGDDWNWQFPTIEETETKPNRKM